MVMEPLQDITTADFGDAFKDYDEELLHRAVQIANEIREERPEASRQQIIEAAVRRAKLWWMDRAG